jgi:hypothetical protein
MAYAHPTVMNAIPYNGYVYPDEHGMVTPNLGI